MCQRDRRKIKKGGWVQGSYEEDMLNHAKWHRIRSGKSRAEVVCL